MFREVSWVLKMVNRVVLIIGLVNVRDIQVLTKL
jgi:hypothetical protein